MLQEDKMQDTVNELQKYNIHIATLQETWWPNEGWMDLKDYILKYDAETNIKGRNGLIVCLFFWRDSPQWAMASPFTRFLDHTQRRTTVGKTPPDE